MNTKKNIYFLSDAHLGLPDHKSSLPREKKLVRWLDEIKDDAKEIYLLGDIFDFWYEYKRVVPRGFTRFLGKICEITDSGTPVHFFTGNHDLWVFNYLPQETGMIIHHEPLETEFNGVSFYLAHGDGLGKYDKGFRLMKKVFTNKIAQLLFSRLHPNFSMALGLKWSINNRYAETREDLEFKGEEKEWLILHAKDTLEIRHFDYFIFGHRHYPLELDLGNNSRFINLGDWISHFTYAVFDGEKTVLKEYKG